jgi:hypothetical protein
MPESCECRIGEIRATLKKADASDFASDSDVAALAVTWGVNSS